MKREWVLEDRAGLERQIENLIDDIMEAVGEATDRTQTDFSNAARFIDSIVTSLEQLEGDLGAIPTTTNEEGWPVLGDDLSQLNTASADLTQMNALANLFRSFIETLGENAPEERRYFLDKLVDMNRLGEALGEYLKTLNDMTSLREHRSYWPLYMMPSVLVGGDSMFDIGARFCDSKSKVDLGSIKKIKVRCGSLVDSIQLYYGGTEEENAGDVHGGGGGRPCEWEVPPGHKIVQVEGRSGGGIDQLQFFTDKGESSPVFGNNNGKIKNGNPFVVCDLPGRELKTIAGTVGKIRDHTVLKSIQLVFGLQ